SKSKQTSLQNRKTSRTSSATTARRIYLRSRASTRRGYESVLDIHLLPHFGNLPVVEVSASRRSSRSRGATNGRTQAPRDNRALRSPTARRSGPARRSGRSRRAHWQHAGNTVIHPDRCAVTRRSLTFCNYFGADFEI